MELTRLLVGLLRVEAILWRKENTQETWMLVDDGGHYCKAAVRMASFVRFCCAIASMSPQVLRARSRARDCELEYLNHPTHFPTLTSSTVCSAHCTRKSAPKTYFLIKHTECRYVSKKYSGYCIFLRNTPIKLLRLGSPFF